MKDTKTHVLRKKIRHHIGGVFSRERRFGNKKKTFKTIVLFFLIFYAVLVVTQRPSHDRDWEVGMEELPHIVIKENDITIENFRDFNWHDDGNVDVVYEERTFNLDEMETVDVVISHFDDFEGLAHIFVSFGFVNGEHIIISFETRREKDEEFSPFLGMLRQFEIVYVVGSEEDIIGLRTDVRGERVYLYPTIATPEKAQELFLKLALDINDVYAKPRIYHTLTHNCTNEITRRVEDISDYNFPLTWKAIFPGYFDEVLVDMGLILNERSFEETKKQHKVDNDAVDRYDPNFSRMLRENGTILHK